MVVCEQPGPADLQSAPNAAERLKLTEIFLSLQGESTLVGHPTVFVRLTGCPLRCSYCDTAYAFYGGTYSDVPSVVKKVPRFWGSSCLRDRRRATRAKKLFNALEVSLRGA